MSPEAFPATPPPVEKPKGLKILGKIDISAFEKKKKTPEKRNTEEIKKLLHEAMQECVPMINQKIQRFEGAPTEPLINEHGHIRMEAFSGTYSQEIIDQHTNAVLEKKKSFYETNSLAKQQKYGTSDENELVRKIDAEGKMTDGHSSEQILFLLMNKIAGDRFVIVRSADYDDFEHGTDLLLVDTITGKPICAFDETVSNEAIERVSTQLKSPREKKLDRAKEKLQKGKGMSVDYGLTFSEEDGQEVVRLGRIDHIPPLLLVIEKKDLTSLLQEMDFSPSSSLSSDERRVLETMIHTMEQQIIEFHTLETKEISFDAIEHFLQFLKNKLVLNHTENLAQANNN